MVCSSVSAERSYPVAPASGITSSRKAPRLAPQSPPPKMAQSASTPGPRATCPAYTHPPTCHTGLQMPLLGLDPQMSQVFTGRGGSLLGDPGPESQEVPVRDAACFSAWVPTEGSLQPQPQGQIHKGVSGVITTPAQRGGNQPAPRAAWGPLLAHRDRQGAGVPSEGTARPQGCISAK